MGDAFVKNEFSSENGAEGAYWPDTKQTLGRACLDIQNYRKSNGRVYGSPRLLTTEWESLRRPLEKQFQKLTGLRFDQSANKWTDSEIQLLYEEVRKGYYKVHRDGKAILSDRPLFGFVDGEVTLYAHTAWISDEKAWVIKVGYTSGLVKDLLSKRERAHTPKLLATTPGSKSDEDHFHRKWKRRVASGNEWYWPENDIAEYIASEFETVVPDYWALVREIQKSMP